MERYLETFGRFMCGVGRPAHKRRIRGPENDLRFIEAQLQPVNLLAQFRLLLGRFCLEEGAFV
jgi:hypothetical protein